MQADKDPAIEQKRSDARQRRLLKAHMLHPRFGRVDILVRDVSAHGIGGKCDFDLLTGESVTICLPSRPPITGRVAWSAKRAFGIQLDQNIDPLVVRSSSESAAQPYQVPDSAQPTGDFKRPGFGRHRRD
jgi:hypothetical protein